MMDLFRRVGHLRWLTLLAFLFQRQRASKRQAGSSNGHAAVQGKSKMDSGFSWLSILCAGLAIQRGTRCSGHREGERERVKTNTHCPDVSHTEQKSKQWSQLMLRLH